MKKSRLIILATSLMMAFTAFASGCQEESVEYGEWVITNYPTATASGTIKRVSVDGKKVQELAIPAISDTEFWTLETSTAATHTEDGSATYTSEYGSVTIKIAATGHDYKDSKPTVVDAPTYEKAGKAVVRCTAGDAGELVIILPAISNNDYEVETPTHTGTGKAIFVTEYGEIEIELPPLGHDYVTAPTYKLTRIPTETDKGRAVEFCSDYENEEEGKKGSHEVEVPALSDADTWTLDTVAATHTAEGKKTYTSKYGVVEVTLPATGHDYLSEHTLEIIEYPTIVKTGKAVEYCADYENEAEGEKGSREIIVPALGDKKTWTVTETEPTHTADGKRVYVSKYGKVEIVLPALGHDYIINPSYAITVEPTETEKGKAIEYCTDYATEAEGEKGSHEIEIPALGDKKTWTVTETAPTHANDGKKVYTSKYGKVEIVLPALGHNYEGETTFKLTVNPTETEKGKAIEYCADYVTEKDGEKGSREVEVPALSDESVWSVESTAATHTRDGLKIYTSKYGTVEVVVPALGHDYEGETTFKLTVNPTETEKGKAIEYCVDYENEAEGEKGSREVEVPALSDESVWSVDVTAATHTKDGLKVYTSKYGTVEITLPALGHDYEGNTVYTITLEPTETEKGKAIEYCVDYENEAEGEKGSREIEIPALSDREVWKVTTATATHTRPGSATYTSVYGTVTKTVSSLGHDYTSQHALVMTVEPTLTETGKAIEYCADYENEAEGEKGSREVIVPVLSDTSVWEVDVTAATHTAAGLKVYTSKYGTVEIILPALGHDYTSQHALVMTVEPTLTETGKAIEYCADYESEEEGEKGSREVIVPVLTNQSVWTKTTVPADYDKGSVDTYVSVFGKVTVNNNDRLLYPYESRSYSSVTIEAAPEDDDYGYLCGNPRVWVWETSPLVLNSNGAGVGKAFPYSVDAQYRFYDYDFETGKVLIKTIPKTKKIYVDENGEEHETYEYLEENAIYSHAYVDFNTGIIIKPVYSTYNYLAISVPGGWLSSSDFSVSSWNGAIVLQYAYEDGTLSAFVTTNRVYFNVSFTDADGIAVAAGDCYGADNLYIKNSAGEIIAAYGFNGVEMVELDGLQGKYAQGDKTITVTGYGQIKENGVTVAKYSLISGTQIGVTSLDGTAYDVYTLSQAGMTFTSYRPTVTVEYDLGGATITNADQFAGLTATDKGYKNTAVNQNAQATFPVPQAENKIFFGWKTADGKLYSDGDKVTSDLYLTAEWKNLVVLYYVDIDGVKQTINAAEGALIGSYLPVYDTKFDEENLKFYEFAGWNVDGNDIPEDTEVVTGAAGLTLEITWNELAGYVGSYKGVNIYSGGYGNSSEKTLTITSDGKISGVKSGVVVSYDAVTGKITWKTSATATTEYYLWFDIKSGVIAADYSFGNKIGADIYVFGNAEYQTSGKMEASYGVYDQIYGKYEAQFAKVNTRNGLTDVFTYGNRIYSNITITDVYGNKLEIADIKNSKSVIVIDNDTGKTIFKAATTAISFTKGNNSDTVRTLDNYYGVYAFGDETVELDGIGGVTYGDNTGTYEAVEGKDYGFDVYFNDDTEYWRLTLSGETCTMVKPMVTVSYNLNGKTVSAEEMEKIADYQANVGIEFTLPVLENIGDYVFRGWYLDSLGSAVAGDRFVATKNVTLYANWQIKYSVTVNANNGVEVYALEYAGGETVVLEKPTYKGYRFLGWYTTEDFAEGTEWTAGYAIKSSVKIYAKWTEAPKYNNVYTPVEIYGTNANGAKSSIYLRNYGIIDVDPDGVAPKTGYPFNGGETQIVEAEDYATTGALTINSGSTVFKGFIDPVSQIIVTTYKNGLSAEFGQVMLLTPHPTDKLHSENQVASSYWDEGMTRVIVYTYEGTSYNVFVWKGKVYFGVTFSVPGQDTFDANNAFTAETLLVTGADGELLVKFGFDGTTMVALDGLEGEYKLAGEENASMTLNGIDKITVNGAEGTYYVAEGKDYTLDVYLEGSYYRITADKEAKTYSIVKPMVEISYDLGGVETFEGEPEAEFRNVNIAYELPWLTSETMILRGWYAESDESTVYASEYTPVANVTLKAKWDKKVTLTVIYGNGLGDVTLVYGQGDVPAPQQPPFTDGKVFDGWYTDDTFETEYSATSITENTTIYCKWIEAVPYYGTYGAGVEVWGASGYGYMGARTTALVISTTGVASGAKSGTITNYDAETGLFTIGSYAGLYNDKDGIIAYNYSSGGTSLKSDVYVYIKGITKTSCSASADQFVWNSGLSRIFRLTVTYTDGTTGDYMIFIDGNKIYGNVSYEAESAVANVAGLKNVAFTIKDSSGNVVYTK